MTNNPSGQLSKLEGHQNLDLESVKAEQAEGNEGLVDSDAESELATLKGTSPLDFNGTHGTSPHHDSVRGANSYKSKMDSFSGPGDPRLA